MSTRQQYKQQLYLGLLYFHMKLGILLNIESIAEDVNPRYLGGSPHLTLG